jgi:iron only hydrogenase large subunit-like protein
LIKNITTEEIEKILKEKEIDVKIEKKPNEEDVSTEELTKLITEHVKQIINN